MTEQSTQAQERIIRGWCMYDWANSVYNLVITTTFFPVYFESITVHAYGDHIPFLGRTFKSISLYTYAASFAYLVVAVLLPILSSIADSSGKKKQFMKFFTWMGGLACMGLFWFKGDQPNMNWGLTCFIMASIGYAGSLVFYNSYLPEIAPPEKRDIISARGFAMGYLGSVLLQLIGFGLVFYFSSKGNNTLGLLITFLLVGLWWIGFAQITFSRLPSHSPIAKKGANFLLAGFHELINVWIQIKRMPVLKWYLSAVFLYSMGVQTVMLIATLVGKKILGLSELKLIISIVLIQLVAIPGAIGISKLSGRFGNFYTLMGVIILWICICLSAYQVVVLKEVGTNVEYHFYGLAVCVGLVMGGIQSLSRSTYSKLMPVTQDTASFFSFYDVTEKIAVVIGMFMFGYLIDISGAKNSILMLSVYFILGWIMLYIANQKQKHEKTHSDL